MSDRENPPGGLTITAQNETDKSISISPRDGYFAVQVNQTIRLWADVRLNRSELTAFVAAAQEMLEFYK